MSLKHQDHVSAYVCRLRPAAHLRQVIWDILNDGLRTTLETARITTLKALAEGPERNLWAEEAIMTLKVAGWVGEFCEHAPHHTTPHHVTPRHATTPQRRRLNRSSRVLKNCACSTTTAFAKKLLSPLPCQPEHCPLLYQRGSGQQE